MEQVPTAPAPAGQNQGETTGFWAKYGPYVAIVAVIAAIAIGYAVSRNDNKEEGNKEEKTEQTTPPASPAGEQNQTQTPTSPSPGPQAAGNVTTTGILEASDDIARGNLMVVENDGDKIYVSTKRDFLGILGKQVTLEANGTINSFVFLGFKEAGVTPAPSPTPAVAGTVNFSGKIQKSDNEVRGNYLIISDSTKVYLKSVHDFTAWIGSEVSVTANGSIESFTGAVLRKK